MPYAYDNLTQIKQLLSNAKKSLKTSTNRPKDYATFTQHVADFELNQEIEALTSIVNSDDAQTQFKERCQWRANFSQDLATFNLQKPQDPTNRLYWEIAVLLFQPKSVGNLLGIVSPSPDINRISKSFNLSIMSEIDLHNYISDYTKGKTSDQIREEIIKKGISIQSSEDLASLLRNVSEKFYDSILKNIYPVASLAPALNHLVNNLESAGLTRKQKTALAQAITNNISLLTSKPIYLLFSANDPLFLQAGLDSRTREQNFSEVVKTSILSNFVFSSTSDRSHILKEFLMHLSKGQRFALISRRVAVDGTLLHRALRNPPNLVVLFEVLTPEQRMQIVQTREPNGDTFLHHLVRHPKSLAACLHLIKELNWTVALSKANNAGQTPIQCAADNPDTIVHLVNLLPEEQRLLVLSAKDSQCDTILHQSTARYPLFLLLPEEHRFAALHLRNKQGKSVLENLLESAELPSVLTLFDEDIVLTLLKTKFKVKDKNDEETLLDICNESKMKVLLSKAPFKSSFIPKFINIYAIIKEQLKQAQLKSNTFFDLKAQANRLLNQIDQAKNCKEIREILVSFFEQNPNSPISRQALAPHDAPHYHLKLSDLRHSWELDKAGSILSMEP